MSFWRGWTGERRRPENKSNYVSEMIGPSHDDDDNDDACLPGWRWWWRRKSGWDVHHGRWQFHVNSHGAWNADGFELREIGVCVRSGLCEIIMIVWIYWNDSENLCWFVNFYNIQYEFFCGFSFFHLSFLNVGCL